MNRIIGPLFMLVICSLAIGQEQEKAGYIGVNFGTSYLLNGTYNNNKMGANLNVLNFGYSFKSKIGLTCKWMGAAHIISDDNKIGYGAILVGPMYSFDLSENLLLDVKVQSGLFWTVEEVTVTAIDNPDPNLPSSSGKYSTSGIKSLSAGLALRHNFSRRWNWMFLAEFNSGPSTGFFVKSERINTISANLGIGFRL